MTRHVFVLGADRFNMDQLRSVPGAVGCEFHVLASYEQVKGGEVFPAGPALRRAREVLDAFDGSIDAILGWWDFPVSTLLPILRREYGTPGATLESALRCEHKYWSRLEQARSVPRHVPAFRAFDPFAEGPLAEIGLPFPFWVKPVKSVASYLGFEVRDRADFASALATLRANIHRLAEPFDLVLGYAELPPEVARVGGRWCLAEDMISDGWQCTLEGYVHDGETTVYGIVDSIREGERGSSFSRYQYPSALPSPVQERMIDVTRRFMARIDYDQAPFNAEFYWDRERDAIWLLEVNARISKSHAPLFAMVDGEPHHGVNLQLALGERPVFPHRAGRWPVAAKFMLRVHDDATCERAPGPEAVAAIEARYADARIEVHVSEGMRLSELPRQDSYSYEVAVVHLGAESEQGLLASYDDCVERLGLVFGKGAA